MKIYSRFQAIKRMNELATDDIPFLFLIDYTQEQSYILPLHHVDPSVCLFHFREAGNAPAGSDTSALSTTNQPLSPIKWHVMPPSPDSYKQAFDLVRHHLLAGNSYLTNLTCKLPLDTNLTLEEMFRHARAPYKLWLKERFVCFSPEPFVRIEDGLIKSYPMKGTIDATLPQAAQTLLDDPKEAAEHATIVDLIRNDLSMISERVTVTNYRYIECLSTHRGPLLQTSSEITGTLPPDYANHLGDLLFRLLPAGSITGAPKPKTQEIIAQAEDYQRGFYTGIMGLYANERLDSAVMIRFVEQENGQLYFKAGGGITARSQWENEYQEIIQKAYVPIY